MKTAAAVVKHMTLGVQGLGCEDALTHLLNYVWPCIFEQVSQSIAVKRFHGVFVGRTKILVDF